MQKRRPILPPSRSVLILLPLNLIEVLDQAADIFRMSRSDVIRRSLLRDVTTQLREEVTRAQQRVPQSGRPKSWSL
jgi:Arc/MetJ-type ribon-helix-helix transcriptional regulator